MTSGFGMLRDRAKMLTGVSGKVGREKAMTGSTGLQKPGGIEHKRAKNAFGDIATKATGGLLAQYKPELTNLHKDRKQYIQKVKAIGVSHRSIRRQTDHFVGTTAWKDDMDRRSQRVEAICRQENWTKGRIEEVERKRADWQKNVFKAHQREMMSSEELRIFDEEASCKEAAEEKDRTRREKWVYLSDRCFVDSTEARRIENEKFKVKPEHLSKCEADLPITTFLRRELKPKVADAASRILLHDYHTVREVRADWRNVKARFLRNLLKGKEIAKKLEDVLTGLGPADWIRDLFNVVPPKDFVDTSGTTATVQEVRMMQKYFLVCTTCRQVRKYWKTLKPAATKNFDEYRVAHMESSWLFHLDDEPNRWIRQPQIVLRQEIEMRQPPRRRSAVEEEVQKDEQEHMIQAMVLSRAKRRAEEEKKRKGSAKNSLKEPWGRDTQARKKS
jgi:hypothetical protein